MSDLIDRQNTCEKIGMVHMRDERLRNEIIDAVLSMPAVEPERTAHPTCETCGHAKPHPTRLETMRICFVNSATQWHKDDYCSHHTEAKK